MKIGRNFVVLTLLISLCLLLGIGSASYDVKQISGSGSGELILKIAINDSIRVFSGSYSYDILDINIPPISTPFNITGSEKGYAYNLSSVYMPNKPNDFTVSVSKVKNLNIGLKKLQGSYENSSMVWNGKYARVWVTTQIVADKSGVATTTNDLLSPGSYQAKIFGDAAENATQVNLTMTLVKKIVVSGPFNVRINTTGFPSGKYSITAKALNGSFNLYEIALD